MSDASDQEHLESVKLLNANRASESKSVPREVTYLDNERRASGKYCFESVKDSRDKVWSACTRFVKVINVG